jgi:hypothetical protein
MMEHRFGAEQRRALAMLATADRNGAPQALLSAHGFDASLIAGLVNRGLASLSAHGFDASLIAGLVNRGLASLTAEKILAGGKLIAVAKARITAAGREALTSGD